MKPWSSSTGTGSQLSATALPEIFSSFTAGPAEGAAEAERQEQDEGDEDRPQDALQTRHRIAISRFTTEDLIKLCLLQPADRSCLS